MSKYGFNENEVVKTITDMIDKDGFHKQVVTYGKPGSGSESFAIGADLRLGPQWAEVELIAINIPGSDSYIICASNIVDDEYVFNVGDVLIDEDIWSFNGDMEFDSKLSGANIAIANDVNPANGMRYYQAYVIDAEDNKVLARAKAEIDVPLYDPK